MKNKNIFAVIDRTGHVDALEGSKIRVKAIYSRLSTLICSCQEVLAQTSLTWHGLESLMNTHSHTHKTKRSDGLPALGHFCHVCSCVTGWDHPNHMHLSPFSPLFIHTNLFVLEEREREHPHCKNESLWNDCNSLHGFIELNLII